MNARRKRILILDTDEEVLINLERILEDEGFDTTTTWDMGEALSLLRSKDFDLLLAGEHPPEMGCARILRSSHRDMLVPCVIMQSAARHPFEAEYLCSLGAYAVIGKRNPKKVVDKIKECLCSPRHQAFKAMAAGAA